MKKLLLVATLGVAGFMSANNITSSVKLKPNVNSESQILKAKKYFGVTFYLTITTSCGTTRSGNYYFNFNNPTQANFDAILQGWNEIDCGGQQGGSAVKGKDVSVG